MKNIFELIKDTRFFGLKAINLYDALTIPRKSVYYPKSDTFTLKKELQTFISGICSNTRGSYVKSINNSSILLVYSNQYYVKANKEKFLKIAQLPINADCICPQDQELIPPERLMALLMAFKMAFLYVIWLVKLIGIKAKFIEKLHIVNHIGRIYNFLNLFKKIDVEKYKLLVVYYNVTPCENALMQLFASKGVKNATLQHGLYCMDFSESMQYGYISRWTDYYLMWDSFSKQDMINHGVNPDQILVTGIPAYINQDKNNVVTTEKINTNKSCCVFLDGTELAGDEQNHKLLCIMKEFTKKNNMFLLIKPHHASFGGSYDKYLDDDCKITDLSVIENAKQCDFSVCLSSSVFAELCYLRLTVFRFPTTIDGFEFYSDITNVAFNNIEELEKLYNDKARIKNAVVQNAGIFGCENSREKYLDFFSKFAGDVKK